MGGTAFAINIALCPESALILGPVSYVVFYMENRPKTLLKFRTSAQKIIAENLPSMSVQHFCFLRLLIMKPSLQNVTTAIKIIISQYCFYACNNPAEDR